jgi:hypothetical protein
MEVVNAIYLKVQFVDESRDILTIIRSHMSLSVLNKTGVILLQGYEYHDEGRLLLLYGQYEFLVPTPLVSSRLLSNT